MMTLSCLILENDLTADGITLWWAPEPPNDGNDDEDEVDDEESSEVCEGDRVKLWKAKQKLRK